MSYLPRNMADHPPTKDRLTISSELLFLHMARLQGETYEDIYGVLDRYVGEPYAHPVPVDLWRVGDDLRLLPQTKHAEWLAENAVGKWACGLTPELRGMIFFELDSDRVLFRLSL